MPKRDINQLAKHIINVATGVTPPNQPKNITKSKAGRAGGLSRAKLLKKAQRAEIAKIAADARWKK